MTAAILALLTPFVLVGMLIVLDKLCSVIAAEVRRAELAARTGQSDRAVRKEIEQLRMAGHIIGNRQDGSGYFLIGDDDKEALCAQYRQMRRRALNILKQTTPIRRKLKEIDKECEYGKF